jgi:sulfur carrier protein ThiS
VGLNSDNNLESILAKTPIPKEFGLISIDIDSCDYYIWESIIQYKPIVVVIEYNPTVPNDIVFIQEQDMSVNQGSSLLALIELGKQKGYELIAVTSTNGIFVRAEYYSQFNIKDNDINKMKECIGKRIWQGYDGTIFTSNFSYLVWKKRPIDPEELQVLPKSERFYGSRIPLEYQPQSQLQAIIPEAPGENIAINKPAQQSSVSKWSKPDESRKVVNGEKNGKFSFCTNKEINPWWQVDLEETYTLTEVRIYNRLDAGSERANTLRILLSSDATNWEEVYAHDKSLQIGGIDGTPLIVSMNSKVARYVRLQLNEENYLHLDEVEVYGIPVNEAYTSVQ